MPRKGENIYKRKDGRWEARYIRERTPEGKIRYGYLYAGSYREARQKLRSCPMPTEKQEVVPEYSLAQAFESWYAYAALGLKETSCAKYRYLADQYILPSLGSIQLSALTEGDIEHFCAALLHHGGSKQKGLSSKTASDTLSLIRNTIAYAKKMGLSCSCDAKSVQVKQKAPNMRVLTLAEQERLSQYLFASPNGFHIGILLCLYTGLRIGELCALRWEDVDLSDQTIYVRNTIQRIRNLSDTGSRTKIIITPPKSACSRRLIPLPDHINALLGEYRQVRCGYVLTNSDTRFVEPRTMQNHFRSTLRSCGIEHANFHALRHTFATRCVELGFDVKSLSEILGHASVNITMNRYVHPSMELKKENMQRLSNLIAVH